MSSPFSIAKNYVSSTLSAAISNSDTSLTVASGAANFPTGRQIIRLHDGTNNELILIDSRSGSTLTGGSGGRGYGGTTALAWSAGAAIELVMTANHLDELQTAVTSLEKLPLHGWGMATGIYTIPHRSNSFSTTALQPNKLYLVPIQIDEEVTVGSILCRITTAGTAGSLVRLGLWRPIGGLKFNLVVDAGTVPGDVVGDTSLPLSVTLSPAIYAGTILHNSTTDISFRSASFTGAGYYHLFPQTSLDSTAHLASKNMTFGALPASILPSYSITGGVHIPLIGVGVT